MTLATVEPTHEVVAHVDPGGNIIAWARALSAAHQVASALCSTSFVPRHFANKPEEAAAALMLGDELGLSPVSALRSIFVIGGTPGMYARTMVALVQSRGHEVWTDTDTANKVVVCGRREGSDKVERAEWTIDRARRAGYTNNKKYETDPQAMLYARASSDVCRRIAADVLSGIPYSVEELEVIDAEKPTRQVRRKVEPPPRPEPELEAPAPVPGSDQTPDSPLLNTSSALAKRLFATFSDAGITERDDRLRYVSDVVGRDIASSSEMTDADASAVLDALRADLEQPFETEAKA